MERQKKRISDGVKEVLVRWWIAGMCYFFIGVGTQAGLMQSPLDLVFFLGVGIGLVTVVIYNPIVYGMFDVKRNGRIVNDSYYEKKGRERILYNLSLVFLNIVIVSFVYLTYQGINEAMCSAEKQPSGTILFPCEPFGFATFYVLYYYLLLRVGGAVRKLIGKAGKTHG
jgi:hypothetical protein